MLDRPGLPPAESSVKLRKPGSPRSTRRWPARSAAELSPLFVADSHWRNLFGISWHFATFSGNATVVAELLARVGRGRRRGISASTRRARAARRRWSAAATSSRRSLPSRPSTARAIGAVRLLREADGAVATPGRFRPRSISMPICAARDGGRRDIPRPRFRRPRLARAAAGRRAPTTTAIPTC